MRIVVLVMLSLMLGGCNWYWHWPPWRAPGAVVRTGAGPLDGQDGADPTVYLVDVRITSVEVPVGVASGSEKMWSYLDEERSKAVRDATMPQNGVRLGVAPASTWPDLVKVLQEMTGTKLVETTTPTLPGIPLAITLKPNQPQQFISTWSRDRPSSSQDYPPGDNLLLINCSLNELDYNKLIVTGVPQIRSTDKVRIIRNEIAGPTIAYESERFTLDACTFQLMLTSGEILILGPGAESRKSFSVGRHFLVHQKDGLECETILVIVPTIRKVPLKVVAPSK